MKSLGVMPRNILNGQQAWNCRKAEAKAYRQAATQMLADLSTDRYQRRSRNVSFLLHSTGRHPAGSEIDASIVYADYYYLEALLRLRQLQ